MRGMCGHSKRPRVDKRERECARARVERYKSKQIRKDGEDEVGSRSGSTQ